MEIFLIEFSNWFLSQNAEHIIALDGKRIRGSNVHLLHALSTRFGIVLAQVDIENKILEIRRCWSTDNIDWIKQESPDWHNLKSVCCIERERHIKNRVETETVFYISSTDPCSKKYLAYSRQHWHIENQLHWVLDVIFNEDRSTLSATNAAQNMAVVRKLVLNMIKRYKAATGHKIAIKTARKASG